MKEPDTGSARRDPVERAHLKHLQDVSHEMHRYAPGEDVTGLVRRYWVPVWSVPQEAPQQVLQYPVCLVVVSGDYARFYGVVRGLSTTTLQGRGWAVGVMLAPAAGYLIAGPVDAFTDRHVDLSEVLGTDGERLVTRVRAVMADDPYDITAHRSAVGDVEDVLRRFLPVDAEGELVNAVVSFIEDDPHVLRVAQLPTRAADARRMVRPERKLDRRPRHVLVVLAVLLLAVAAGARP